MIRLRGQLAFDPDRREPESGFRSPRQTRKKGRANMSEYEVQANEFLKRAETKMSISRTGEVQGFPGDTGYGCRLWRYKYQVTMTRHKKQYRFTFYDSHENWRTNKRPSRYSVLACVEKYPAEETTEDFAREFGYALETAQEYRRVEKIRSACQQQYERLLDLFGEDLMKELREIN